MATVLLHPPQFESCNILPNTDLGGHSSFGLQGRRENNHSAFNEAKRSRGNSFGHGKVEMTRRWKFKGWLADLLPKKSA